MKPKWTRACLVCFAISSALSIIASDEKHAGQTQKEKNPMVLMKTSKGDITIELYLDKAPVSVENFLRYVDEGFYSGTIFHRVIDGFMIQGGGFTENFQKKKTHAPIKNEADNGLENDAGTIAMARTNVVDSASSQFFINVKDNDFLNHRSKNPSEYGYCVFGKVVDGMDVVNRIKTVKTGNHGPYQNVPEEAVEILSVTRVED